MNAPVCDVALSTQIRQIGKEDTLDLRHAVLWPNLPVSDVCLPEDDLGVHYGAFHPPNISPIAIISLFVEDLPSIETDMAADDTLTGTTSEDPNSTAASGRTGESAVRFRKFACSLDWQGKGVGTRLLLHALSMARVDLGVTVAWCDARTATQDWYRRRGFVAFGPVFYKKDVEYVRMWLDLTSDNALVGR
ncbi:hypothetical protein D9619_007511 [Psilocybe cf. subviscida]|uniref:N-acetyltransferase domain-containing protein n=1 Tax=Psilocybe cf. subviscida TaxID=2480587 RepID=A0A8H5B1P6_9AGAR|nr:hypothetical protein D9619_007511 [Psilocybe cf. subviscida]